MSSYPDVSDAVLVAIRQIIRAVDLHSKRLVQQHGLTGPQLVVLKELARMKVASTSELALGVSLSSATVTGILNRLQKRDLVARAKSALDRRKTEVTLTDEGRAIADSVRNLLQDRFVSQLHELADWEQTQLLSAFQRVAFMMEASELEASPVLVTGPVDASADETLEFLTEDTTPPQPQPKEPLAPSAPDPQASP